MGMMGISSLFYNDWCSLLNTQHTLSYSPIHPSHFIMMNCCCHHCHDNCFHSPQMMYQAHTDGHSILHHRCYLQRTSEEWKTKIKLFSLLLMIVWQPWEVQVDTKKTIITTVQNIQKKLQYNEYTLQTIKHL